LSGQEIVGKREEMGEKVRGGKRLLLRRKSSPKECK